MQGSRDLYKLGHRCSYSSLWSFLHGPQLYFSLFASLISFRMLAQQLFTRYLPFGFRNGKKRDVAVYSTLMPCHTIACGICNTNAASWFRAVILLFAVIDMYDKRQRYSMRRVAVVCKQLLLFTRGS